MIEIKNIKGNDLTNDKLIPDLKRMQEELKQVSVEELIRKSGARYESNRLCIGVFFQEFEIDRDNFIIKNSDGNPESIMFQSIVLSYLTTSDGTLPSKKLISFRELPDGSNYCHAFQGYAPDRLASHFQQDIDGFIKTCSKIGGIPVDIGDAGYEFEVFPKIKITCVYYLGEEAFPSGASLLFDSSVSHYMVTAGLASIGSKLVDVIIGNSAES